MNRKQFFVSVIGLAIAPFVIKEETKYPFLTYQRFPDGYKIMTFGKSATDIKTEFWDIENKEWIHCVYGKDKMFVNGEEIRISNETENGTVSSV